MLNAIPAPTVPLDSKKQHAHSRGNGDEKLGALVIWMSALPVSLGDQFLESCPADSKEGLYDLLEEPLAVAWGNAAFAKYALGEPLDPASNWYFRPLPEVMGRLLWPFVDRLYATDADINDGLIEHAAMMCQRLLKAGETMARGD